MSASPAMALMTVTSPQGPPSAEAAARMLGVTLADLDSEFGVVAIDPAKGLYCVQVRADRLPASTGEAGGDYRGPFSNPPIGSFRGED